VRQPSLSFASLAEKRKDWRALWQSRNPDPVIGEVVRNFPAGQLLFWVSA